ncbi:alpha/beta-Hydrolases superfamily protein [Rhynchospora pubera]|uniref:Alpha/beta-Hydrolases superfamily protein n=1 Tax=Rhynchospora pubera TaxID=906938 RepID=A0AAV8HKW9_9POAL|nr:alpha/beta-Hydrolases superfamily protein [Rhynchospora pubera]
MKFSLLSLVNYYLRLCFSHAGLRPYTTDIDSVTTIKCWISSALPNKNLTSKSQSSKPILLLIHGFGPLPIWQWHHQVGPLSRHFDLVVPELIFFGGSTTKSSSRSELFQAESLVQLLDALGLGERKDVYVVGTSYGGFVGYHVARLLGEERIKKVVIASSDLLKAEPDDKALLKRAGVESISDLLIPKEPDNMRILMEMALWRPPHFMPNFVLWDVIQEMYNDNIEQKMELIKGITIGNKDAFQLTPLPQEVLIVWGEHDQIFPLDKAHQMQKCLGETARLEVLKNTGHLPQAEDPTRFNEVLLNFLTAS